jgi:hypothetical protein
MRLTRRLLVGAAATILSASAAMAAEPIYMPPPMAPMAPAPIAYNWGGFYVGGFVGRANIFPTPAVGAQVGFNFQPGNLVVGIEARIGRLIGAPPPNTFADGRVKAGFTLGMTGNVLLYGVASLGTVFGAGAPYYTAGGGVEIGFGRISVFAEGVAIGFGGGGFIGNAFQAGMNFHFN